MKIRLNFFFYVLLLLCYVHCGKANNGFSKGFIYDTQQGLASNTIDHIEIDKEGYLYFCTNKGLSIFDGITFTNYNSRNTNDFSNNLTVFLELDDYNALIGSRDKGLFLYNKIRSSVKSIKTNNSVIHNVQSITKTNNSELWIGGGDGVLWYLDDFNKLINQKSEISFSRIIPTFTAINALISIGEEVFIGNQANSVTIIRRKGGIIEIEKSLSINQVESINAFLKVCDDEIWVGTNQGIAILSKHKGQWIVSNHFLKNIGIVRALEICGDEIFAGTEGNGLFRINKNNYSYSFVKLNEYSDLLSNQNYVLSLKADQDNNLWIGTWLGGVVGIRSGMPHFELYKNNNTFTQFSNVIWSINNNTTSNYYFLGTQGNGLCRMQLNEKQIQPVDDTFRSIWTLFADTLSSYLYVGTWGEGLRLYDYQKDKYIAKSFSEIDQERIYTISRFNERLLFIGTSSNGAWFLNEKSMSIYPLQFLDESFNDMNIRGIEKSCNENEYWMATYNEGVFQLFLDNEGHLLDWNQYKYVDKMLIQATKIYQDKSNIWICTSNGLCYISKNDPDKRINRITQLDGYFLSDIKKDANDNFWICSHEGLLYFDPIKLLVNRYLTQFIHYKLYEGDSFLITGTSDGLFYFDPLRIKSIQNNGSVLISSAQIDGQTITPESPNDIVFVNKAINYMDTLVLPASTSNLSFHLSAFLPYVLGEHFLFYKMEGLEDYWNKTEINKSSAVYSNLPSGEYVFRIRLNDMENTIGEKILIIIKKEFWWKTFYAKVFYTSVLIGFMVLLIIYIRRKLKKQHAEEIEKMRYQKEEEVYMQRIRFFTNISHDLKTPLTLLLTPILDLVKHPEMPEQFLFRLQSMHANGDLLLKKINKILNYRNAEIEETSLNIDGFPINQLLYEIIAPFKEYAELQGLYFDFKALGDYSNSEVLYTDRAKFESIIENIVSNAIKYTPENGSVSISYAVENEQIKIVISDTGAGIPSESLSLIFERNYRLNSDNKGTGIGLYLVKFYLDMLKGKIEVDSVLSEGTSFTITLPLSSNKQDDPSQIEQTSQEIIYDNNQNLYRLLIVDDNKEMREYLRQMFSPYYIVTEASDGKEALLSVKSSIPDVIISDLMMSEINGLEFCKEIKNNMVTSHIPFLVLSAKSSIDSRMECLNAGVDLYETKPFNSQLLLTKVINLTRTRKLLKFKYQIAAPLSQHSDDHLMKEETLDDRFLKEVNNAIEKHKDKPDLSIKELSDEVHIKPDQLYRKLKALTGFSANQYIRTYRLNCAAAMLRSKRYMVTEVLYSVGFNNPSYFTKCFKKEFGVLPSEYIEQLDNVSESVIE